MPSPFFSRHSIKSSPSPKETTVPTLTALALPINTSYSSSLSAFNNTTSIFAPVGTLMPLSLAGITFVLLITKTSPRLKYLVIS